METTIDALDSVLSTVTTKRALLVASHALEQAFEGVASTTSPSTAPLTPAGRDDVGGPGLVIGFFQRREYFDLEAARYAALAAHGHVVIVAFTGTTETVPDGVTAVSLADGDPRAEDWVVALVRGGFAATLVARDLHALSVSEATLEASRLFQGWTSLRRHLALEGSRSYLGHLAGRLPADVLARAQHHVEVSAGLPPSRVEDRLADAADHLLRSVDAGYQRATALHTELESTRSRAERDQLTGLHNRHFLERYLGGDERPADLLALLVDVDGLKQVNDAFGHAAGDALLCCVATTLRTNTRRGDVLVRWGGDEFLLLVPHLQAEAGLEHGARLAAAIGASRVDPPWGHLVPSASIGVTPARHTPLPMALLDAALYEVKRHGKGRAGLPPG